MYSTPAEGRSRSTCRGEVWSGGAEFPFFYVRMWEGWCRLRTMRGVRFPSGSSGSAGNGKKKGGGGRGAGCRGRGGNFRCSFPRPRSWHRQARSRGTGHDFLLFFPSIISWDRPGRRAEGACNEPPGADCGQETDCIDSTYSSPRSIKVNG